MSAQLADHALEVQLPFLQVVLGSFAIVPFLVGRADAETPWPRSWNPSGTAIGR